MKNTFKLFGIIALTAIIGFSMAGCDNGSPAGPGGEPPPTPQGFTVTFNSAGGTIVDSQTGIASGGLATEPTPPPTRAFGPGAGLWANPMPTETEYTFDGWFAPGAATPFVFTTPITGNITLTAQWTAPATPVALDLEGTNLVAAAVAYVNTNAGAFTLLVGADVTVTATAVLDAAGVDLTVEGIGERQTKTRTGTGNLFNVDGANRSLTLGNYITLEGYADNTVAVVQVAAGASLTMNAGAQITGNTASADTQAGGVNVTGTGSTFTMNGGEIFGNTATGAGTSGGGVRVATNSTFVMQAGAVIRDNTATGINSAGGVSLQAAGSIFRMLGGEIRGNTATGDTSTVGGARISAGNFQVVTGVIYGGTGANANTGYTNDALLLVGGTATLGTMVGGVFTPSMYEGNPVTLDSTDETIRVVNGVLQP